MLQIGTGNFSAALCTKGVQNSSFIWMAIGPLGSVNDLAETTQC